MSAAFIISALLTAVFARPQGSPSGFGGPFPSCVDSCYPSGLNPGDYAAQCKNATAIDEFNSCVQASSCSDADKNTAFKTLTQLCDVGGSTVTAAPEATFSISSGGSAWPTGNPGWGAGGPVGWSGGMGPFGGPGSGWGPGQWASSGAWTSGPWTNWWGTAGCPASTWSGWTNGPWSTSAPWTSWKACTATTTATSVYTTTVTTSGSSSVVTSTGFGVQVKEATASPSTSTGSSAAMATNVRVAGSAAGIIGLVVGAIVL